jgi:hypothetical protein
MNKMTIYYKEYGDKTCYGNDGGYGDIYSYTTKGFKIIEFKDVDLK